MSPRADISRVIQGRALFIERNLLHDRHGRQNRTISVKDQLQPNDALLLDPFVFTSHKLGERGASPYTGLNLTQT